MRCMTLCIYLWDVLYAIATDPRTITMVQGFECDGTRIRVFLWKSGVLQRAPSFAGAPDICVAGERMSIFASRLGSEAKCLFCLHPLLERDSLAKRHCCHTFLLLPSFVWLKPKHVALQSAPLAIFLFKKSRTDATSGLFWGSFCLVQLARKS
jgi:hypothetical protein